jgi:hypothetical protein
MIAEASARVFGRRPAMPRQAEADAEPWGPPGEPAKAVAALIAATP